MKRWCSGRAMLLGLTATTWLATGVVAQEQAPEDSEGEIARVSLGMASGNAGEVIVVPLYFTPTESVEVGRLELVITYVSVNLKFSKLDLATAAGAAGVDLHSGLKDIKNKDGTDSQVLNIVTSVSSSKPSQKGIPRGVLAYVTLQISTDARSASITLRGSGEVGELGSNQPLKKLKSFETKVDVFGSGAQPLITCFFFTH